MIRIILSLNISGIFSLKKVVFFLHGVYEDSSSVCAFHQRLPLNNDERKGCAKKKTGVAESAAGVRSAHNHRKRGL